MGTNMMGLWNLKLRFSGSDLFSVEYRHGANLVLDSFAGPGTGSLQIGEGTNRELLFLAVLQRLGSYDRLPAEAVSSCHGRSISN